MERFDAFCTKCHAPIDYLSGNIPSADNYNVSEISETGVSCDFCHNVAHPFNGLVLENTYTEWKE